MSNILQAILASSAFTLVMSIIITRIMNKGFAKIDKWQHIQTEDRFLLMTKIDKLGDLTLLTAKKLHDTGVINGDLETLQQEYKQADNQYDEHIRHLAAEILKH